MKKCLEVFAPEQEWLAKRFSDEIVESKSYFHIFQSTVKEFFLGACRGTILAVALKGGSSLLFTLFKRNFNLRSIIEQVFTKDLFKFTRFLAIYVGLLRSVHKCLTQMSANNSPGIAFLSGAIASTALTLDDKTRRKEISLYLFFRAVDVLIKGSVRNNVLPNLWWFQQFLFGVVNIPIMFGFLYEPDILQKGYYRWILSMGNTTDSVLEMSLRSTRRAFFRTGAWPEIKHCYHDGPCSVYCFNDWFLGLERAAKIYLPVHLIPLLLFKYSRLLDKNTVLKALLGLLKSCMFLTTYQSVLKVSVCSSRNTFGADYDMAPVIGALLTSFSTAFESNSRISELLLYCSPRGFEGAWNYSQKRGFVKTIPHFDVILFSITSAILVSTPKQDFKSSFYRALQFLLLS